MLRMQRTFHTGLMCFDVVFVVFLMVQRGHENIHVMFVLLAHSHRIMILVCHETVHVGAFACDAFQSQYQNFFDQAHSPNRVGLIAIEDICSVNQT